jgi:hypothetical protein
MTRLIGVLAALQSAVPISAQTVPVADYTIVVATPTFGADGQVLGASLGFKLSPGARQVIFAAAGRTPCHSMSATLEPSADAGYGWRLELLLREVTADGVFVIDVAWQRRWQQGRALEDVLRRRELRLSEGGRIQLDYLGAAASADCSALGLALEVSRNRRPPAGLFEVDTWLMGAGPGGNVIQHQTVRTRLGDIGKFYFDAVAEGSDGTRGHVEGSVEMRDLSGEEFNSLLTISRKNIDQGVLRPSGSSAFPLKARLGEVVEFRVPMGGFSLRVRVRELR